MQNVARIAAAVLGMSVCASALQADVVIGTVIVGNPGNGGENSGSREPGGDGPNRICGAVDYAYKIGRFEVTAGQYTEFLNAVADEDTYELYNTSMWSSLHGCKIQRAGASPNYSYSVAPDWADRPVNFVSWGDAARFANWLHNGRLTGAQSLATTEAGSYYLDGASTDAELLAVARESNATWVIPSEDEWYKAAYHTNDGITADYWDYPTQSDTAPAAEAPPGTDMTNGSADYFTDAFVDPTYYRTEAGAYDAKPSEGAYGTYDQGGNVAEWNEAVITVEEISGRALRGGSYFHGESFLRAANRAGLNYPTAESFSVGFRVAEVAGQDPGPSETIDVGNPRNAGEPSGEGAGGYGPDRVCGAVGYAYKIGTFEVTARQYTEFLNAVARTDTYGLYNAQMWIPGLGCKIERTGSAGSYGYFVGAAWADRPVNYVTWGDAARFANWLHNGQPTGIQDETTTEDGSYYLNGATTDPELLAVVRKPSATWVIPSEDEWYKAAYYDGGGGMYYDYPTSSNATPSNDLVAPDPGNNATFYSDGYTIGSPYFRTEVRAHENSESPYGTFDQGGNVWEWNEAVLGGPYRGIRGGSFYFGDAITLHAAYRASSAPASASAIIGFRVAEVLHIETEPIGNMGNAGELSGQGAGGSGPDRVCGAVNYAYNIGKFEVTARQYAKFLNAVAGEDTYGLYNTNMGSVEDSGCNIQRSGTSPNFSYFVAADWADRPVNFVSWGDAARFANWIHNDQPTGVQDATTTEDGAYFLDGAMSAAELMAVVRKPGATWAIPSEDEWYKAAYHRNDGVTGNYWDYPTGTNAAPHNANPDDPTTCDNCANIHESAPPEYELGYPYWRTEVGYYSLSGSPYNTFDQGGNVWEWTEAIITDPPYDTARGARGGWYAYSYVYLHAWHRYSGDPTYEDSRLGFRVAEVPGGYVPQVPPVPTVSEWGLVAMILLALATGTLLLNRRRTGTR